jgi:DNA-binding response OmpR family regulator
MGRVVIYEPDDLLRNLLVEWLRQASDAVPAAARVEAVGSADLVVISLDTVERDRLEVIRAMRTIHARTPFIAISSQFRSALPSADVAAQELGVERILAKPFTRDEFLAAVAAVRRIQL